MVDAMNENFWVTFAVENIREKTLVFRYFYSIKKKYYLEDNSELDLLSLVQNDSKLGKTFYLTKPLW